MQSAWDRVATFVIIHQPNMPALSQDESQGPEASMRTELGTFGCDLTLTRSGRRIIIRCPPDRLDSTRRTGVEMTVTISAMRPASDRALTVPFLQLASSLPGQEGLRSDSLMALASEVGRFVGEAIQRCDFSAADSADDNTLVQMWATEFRDRLREVGEERGTGTPSVTVNVAYCV